MTIKRRSFMYMLVIAPISAFIAACRGAGGSSTTAPTEVAEISATPIPATPMLTQEQAIQSTAESAVSPATLPPTPACGDDDDDPTPEQTEGPFYTPNTPARTSFLEDGGGTKLVLTGQVLSTDCMPVAGALIDFWHCDSAGNYDNQGYLFRGHQFADASGSYILETIMPALYPGRTRHIHVKVQAPNQPVLTTQLYFPDEPQNATDGIFHPDLVMTLADAADGKAGSFNFVVTV